jgi:hypothetical protein
VAMALALCASREIHGVHLIVFREPIIYNISFGSSIDCILLRSTANSFTRIPGPITASARCLTSVR